MKLIETALPGVLILEPQVHGDARGFFVETYRASWFEAHDLAAPVFVQDNQSRSRRGVLRGLHYQTVNPQGKLVRCARGAVFDVAVDVRRGSPHFGQSVGVVLDDESHRQIWIPPGFAHGFCVLSDVADFAYKCTSYYDPASDVGIRWNDPALDIGWPLEDIEPLLSAKDQLLPLLAGQAGDKLTVYGG